MFNDEVYRNAVLARSERKQGDVRERREWGIDPYSSCEVIELDFAPPHLADRIAQTYGVDKEQRAQRAIQIVTEHNQHAALVKQRDLLVEALQLAAKRLDVLTHWLQNTYKAGAEDIQLGRSYAQAARNALATVEPGGES